MRFDPRPPRLPLFACLAASIFAHGAAIFVAVGPLGRTKPALEAPPPHDSRAAAIGETFEIPTEEVDPTPAAASTPDLAGPAPSTAGSPGDRAPLAVSSGAAAASRARSGARPVPGAGETVASASGGSAATFGAMGDRSAAPLAAAFTRGFPQAASADPSWVAAPFGSAGSVDVDLTLDERGSLVSVRRVGGNPGPALAEGLRRTVALIRARAFFATGPVTHLRVSVTVSPDEVHDGLHGDVFAIGGGFEAGEGSAFFALAVGRRVDIRVRVVK